MIEFFRGDDRGMAGMFSTSQLISLVLVPLSVVMLWWLRRGPTPSQPANPGRAPAPAVGVGVTPHAFLVAEEHDGLRLDKYLAGEIPNHSRAQVQRLIDEGRVGLPRLKAVKAEQRWCATATPITVEVPEAGRRRRSSPRTCRCEILYDDADIVVVNKPAGLVVHPGAGHASGTLVHALLHHVKDLSGIGGEQRPGIVHRLDKGTSGVMVVAKHDPAHQELARQFHDREVEKEYVALVWGVVHNRRGSTCRSAATRCTARRCRPGRAGPRHAVTRVTWARQLPGVTLIRVAIATGRTHQIRVHLSAIGHAIVGDSRLRRRAHPRPARHPCGAAADAAVPARRAAGLHPPAQRRASGVRGAAARRPALGARRHHAGRAAPRCSRSPTR